MILFDKLFLSLIWLPLLGCLTGGITISIFLSIIWALSGSLASFIQELQSQGRPIIFFSLFSIVLLLVIVFLMNLTWIKEYLFLTIEPVSNFSEIRELDKEDEYLFKDTIWIGMVALTIIIFLITYIGGEPWRSALRASVLLVLPFTVAFWVLSVTKIVVETILLFLRYFVQKRLS